jgi:DNA glycosylase AlkZ-like
VVARLPAAEGSTSLGGVVKGYLHAYGPATPQQFAHWLAAPRQWSAALFDNLAGELEQVEVDGTLAWVAAGDTTAPPTPPRGVRLLPYFDAYAYVVGNQPRELLYPGLAAERALGNFQVLLIDGVVAGVWQQRRSGRKLDITVEPLVPLTPAQRRELDEQVERVGAILEGTPRLTIGTVTVGSHA